MPAECSEEEEPVGEGGVWLAMQGSACQEGQFVSVLAGRRDADRSLPVVVHVAQLVRQHLEVLRLPAHVVEDDVEVGRSHCAGAHGLGDQIELQSFRTSDDRVHDDARRRVVQFAGLIVLPEELRVDPLRHDDECQFDLRLHPADHPQDLFHLLQFDGEDVRDHSLTHSVPIDDDPQRQATIRFQVLLKTQLQIGGHAAAQLVLVLVVRDAGEVPGQGRRSGCRQKRPLTPLYALRRDTCRSR